METPFGILCFLLWAAIALCAFIFWIWVLIDCLTNEASEGNDKLAWALVILLLNLIGALIYYFVRRPARIQELER